MHLFDSDHALRMEQQRSARIAAGETVSAEERRREWLDDQRELRSHARLRGLAFLLVVAPLVIAIASALATAIIGHR